MTCQRPIRFKKSKTRKIEKSKKVTWFQLEIFEFLDFRFSKIFNWNQVIFSIFRFFESDRSLTGHSSELRLYFLIILGAFKRWDSCAFNASKIMQNKIPTAKRQHQTWAKKKVHLELEMTKDCTQFYEISLYTEIL